jgi:hypothetical protein
LFIVPMMTVSPSSTFSRVTLPVIGAVKTVFESRSARFVDRGDRLRDPVHRRFEGGLGDFDVGTRIVDLQGAHQERIPGGQRDQTLEIAFGAYQIGALLRLLRAGLRELGLGPRERGPVLVRLEPEERLAGHDVVAFPHEELRHLRRHVGAHVDRTARTHVPGRRHDLDEVPRPHDFGADLDALVAVARDRGRGDRTGDHDQGDGEDDLGTTLHRAAPGQSLRETPTSASRSVTASW